MTYYVITSANSIANAGTPLGALMLDAGDNLLVTDSGYITSTDSDGDALYVNGYADGSVVTVDGLINGARMGIYSLGDGAQINVSGKVVGASTGISISNGGKLFVAQGGYVSGAQGVGLQGTLINDGTINGTGDDAIQFSGGNIVNNGLISSSFSGIFFSDDATGRITNTGTIQGDLQTWFGATDTTLYLNINNSGSWYGNLGLTPGSDIVKNIGTIDGGINLGDGADTLDSRYGLVTGSISGGAGNDTIRAGAGDDTIDGGAGADTINGGGGHNAVSYNASMAGVKVNLLTGIAKFGDAAGDKLTHIQDITGSTSKDTLVGDNGDNSLTGVLGKDTLTGNGGNDSFLMYGGGNAVINGGAGNDYIQMLTYDSATYGFAFSAANRIDGGTGYDTLDLTNSSSVVLKATTLVNVERIIVEDGYNDSLTTVDATVANKKSLEVDAGSLTSGYGLQFNGSAETNGSFVLLGGSGIDTLKAGAGADQLAGGGGADVLTGGGGADTFIFNDISDSTFAAHDRVVGFKAGTDQFEFDVGVAGVNATITGSVSADADLTALLNGHFDANHAVVVKVNAGALNGQVLLVVDGDGVAGFNAATDYVVDVKGMTDTLTTGDFL